jgi:molecular chaperone GrpE
MKKTGADRDKQAKDLKNQLARALADYDNLRKRVESERKQWGKLAIQSVLSRLLPSLDTLESAQRHLADQGLAVAIKQFKEALKEEGIEEIVPEVGEDFDPQFHEVVESVKGDAYGKIAERVLPGWKFEDGSVIRFAKVKVYGKDSG